jgi:DNA-binding PucR family transcriptional regulator
MASVASVLAALEPLGGRHLGGPLTADVLRVALVEEPATLAALTAGTAAMLTRRASSETTGYRLDLALRRAGDAGVAAVVLHADIELQATALRLAERAGFAVILLPTGVDGAEALLAADRALRPEPESALARVVAAHAAIERVGEASVEAVLDAAGRASGLSLRLSEAGDESRVVLGVLQPGDPAAAVVQRLAADAVGRARRRQSRRADLRSRSRAQLLAELLTGTAERSTVVAERARTYGLKVDGWHRVARLELAGALEDDPLAVEERMDDATRIAARVLAGNPSWTTTVVDLGLVLSYVDAHDAEPPSSIAVPMLERLLAAVRGALPAVSPYLGLGGVHVGVLGLRASAAEARSALEAARVAGRAGEVAAYDATGIRRMLVEWLASDTARQSVRELLAPLDELGPERSREMVRTLGSYLDERGSLLRAGRALHLHPNAVAYRMRQITARIDCDLADADQRLALQLACRARLMAR